MGSWGGVQPTPQPEGPLYDLGGMLVARWTCMHLPSTNTKFQPAGPYGWTGGRPEVPQL